MSAALAALLAATAWAGPGDDVRCPEGTVKVATNQQLVPYRCVDKSQLRGDGPFLQMRPAFTGAKCPRGTHQAEDGAMRGKCVMDRPGDAKAYEEPSARPGGGRKLQRVGGTEDPEQAAADAPAPPASSGAKPFLENVLTPETPKAKNAAPAVSSPGEYETYRAHGVRFDVPRGWHVTDGWKDEVPTFQVEHDPKKRGKPVTMLLSRVAPGQPGYEPLAEALSKEKEYHGAQEGAARKVAGLPARQVVVTGESRTVFVEAGGGAYYTFSYAAPKDLFKLFDPAFERLLSSARF